MRRVATIAAGLMAAVGVALAGSPEDDYIAARDAALSRIDRLAKSGAEDGTIRAEVEAMNADLGKRLEAMLPPFTIPGYPAKGKVNLDPLFDSELAHAMLDGLDHSGGWGAPHVLVTTQGLLQRWLAARAAEPTPEFRVPADVETALRSDAFYTYAIGGDAAYARLADLAVAKPPATDLLVAELAGFAQDVGPEAIVQILVAMRKGGVVLIAAEPPKGKARIAACDATWSAAAKRIETLEKAYRDSGSTDEKLIEQSAAARAQGETDYRACFAERAPREPFYADLVKQAQGVADRLAGK